MFKYPALILFLVLFLCHNSFQSDSTPEEEAENEVAALGKEIDSTGDNEPRGILTALGGGLHQKIKGFVSTIKDILLDHHKKIGGFHFRLKDCLEKVINLEKNLLGLKSEEKACPDINGLIDKVKDRLYANDYTVNPHDVQSMAAYLQNQLKNLDIRLQQETKYLNLAFEHIKYLQQFYPVHNAYKPPVKAREGIVTSA